VEHRFGHGEGVGVGVHRRIHEFQDTLEQLVHVEMHRDVGNVLLFEGEFLDQGFQRLLFLQVGLLGFFGTFFLRVFSLVLRSQSSLFLERVDRCDLFQFVQRELVDLALEKVDQIIKQDVVHLL
jgi:hypothetical protein